MLRSFLLRDMVVDTAVATAASVLALGLAARSEGGGALQPLNATSHSLNGPAAARDTQAAWRTTGVGLLTHTAATGFWAMLFELWLRQGPRTRTITLGKAAAMAGVAALIDYRATPKRFTPGWEYVLTPTAMACAYAALGAGLVSSALRPLSWVSRCA